MKKLVAALLVIALGGAAYWYFVLKTPPRKPTRAASPAAVVEPQQTPIADAPAAQSPTKPVDPTKPADASKPAATDTAASKEQPAPAKQESSGSLTGVLFGVLSNVKSADVPRSSSAKEPVVETFGRQGVIEIGTADGTVRRTVSNAPPDQPASTANSAARPKPIDIEAPKINETGESRHATGRTAEREARRAVGSER